MKEIEPKDICELAAKIQTLEQRVAELEKQAHVHSDALCTDTYYRSTNPFD